MMIIMNDYLKKMDKLFSQDKLKILFLDVAVSLTITLLMIIVGELLVANSFTVMRGDAVAYWDMAQEPINPNRRWVWDGFPDCSVPYTYRILTPFLVYRFFNSSLMGFIIIASSSLFISNYLICKISRLYTSNIQVGYFIALSFSTNYTIFSPLINPAMVDLPSIACTLYISYLLYAFIVSHEKTETRIWIFYVVTLIVAVLIKEWVFFILPVPFFFLIYMKKIKKSLMLIMCSVPAFMTHLYVRVIMGPLLPDLQKPDLTLLARYFTTFGAYSSLFATFGALWLVIPLAILFGYKNNHDLKEVYLLPLLAFIISPLMLVIASDHNRYIFYLVFPFIIPIFSLFFDHFNKKLNNRQLFLFYLGFLGSRIAMHYRPIMQVAFAPTAGQSEGVIVFIILTVIVQISVMIYYLILNKNINSLFSQYL